MGSSGGGGIPGAEGIPNSGHGVPIAGQGPPTGGPFGQVRGQGQDQGQLRGQLAALLAARGSADPRGLDKAGLRAAAGQYRGGADLGRGTPSQWGGPHGMGGALMGGGGGPPPPGMPYSGSGSGSGNAAIALPSEVNAGPFYRSQNPNGAVAGSPWAGVNLSNSPFFSRRG